MSNQELEDLRTWCRESAGAVKEDQLDDAQMAKAIIAIFRIGLVLCEIALRMKEPL